MFKFKSLFFKSISADIYIKMYLHKYAWTIRPFLNLISAKGLSLPISSAPFTNTLEGNILSNLSAKSLNTPELSF